MKNRAEIPAEKLKSNEVSERPWQHILVDFIMKLPVSRNYNSILVVCDRFLKMLHFIVIIEKITAKGLAKLFRNNVWKLHGLLKSVISNREPQFVTRLMKKLNKILGIKTKLSMAFHL